MSSGPNDAERVTDAATIEYDPGLDIEVLRRRRVKVLAVLAVAMLLTASVITAHYLFRTPPVVTSQLIAVAHETVRGALGRDFAYQFTGQSETTVEYVSEGRYLVSAEVSVISAAGQVWGYRFNCTLARLPDADGWAPAKLELVPN